MGDYPDPDEEFELMYGDEFELIREQEQGQLKKCYKKDNIPPPAKCRKSLDFGKPLEPTNIETVVELTDLNGDTQSSNLCLDDPTFTSQIALDTAQKSPEPVNNKKRTIDDLFGDISDIGDDIIFDDQPNVKKPKGDEKEEDLALIDHILELRKLSREKLSIPTIKRDHLRSDTERDKHNVSYSVPKYPFIVVSRLDKTRVYIRFHSEEYEKEETERMVKECSYKGVISDGFREVWTEAQNLV